MIHYDVHYVKYHTGYRFVMDLATHIDLIQQIVNPDPSNAPKLLRDLGLAEPPSPEQVRREIEEELLPKPALPKHWLPHFQVFGPVLRDLFYLLIYPTEIGSTSLT